MPRLSTLLVGAGALAVSLLLIPGIGAAQPVNETGNSTSDSGDGAIVDLSGLTDAVDGLTEAFQNFTQQKSLSEILLDILVEPFRKVFQVLLEEAALILTTTPSVDSNPAVKEIHGQTLIVAFLVSTLAFMAAGLLHMMGPILGVSYSQVRKILPRIITGLVFASVSLPLLQLAVDFSDALVYAFKPSVVSDSIGQMLGTRIALVLVLFIKATLLLLLIVLFIIRDIYILFVAAISPLLAVTWSLPKARRYADTFIAGWFAALAIGPLDMLVLRFSLTMMQGAGDTALQSVSNWIIGISSLTLLLLVPYQVWGASQSAVGQARTLSRGIKKRVRKHRGKKRRSKRRRHKQQYWRRQEEKWDEYRQNRLDILERRNRSNRRPGGDAD